MFCSFPWEVKLFCIWQIWQKSIKFQVRLGLCDFHDNRITRRWNRGIGQEKRNLLLTQNIRNSLLGERRTFIWGEHSEGVANAWGHTHTTSLTLPPLLEQCQHVEEEVSKKLEIASCCISLQLDNNTNRSCNHCGRSKMCNQVNPV